MRVSLPDRIVFAVRAYRAAASLTFLPVPVDVVDVEYPVPFEPARSAWRLRGIGRPDVEPIIPGECAIDAPFNAVA